MNRKYPATYCNYWGDSNTFFFKPPLTHEGHGYLEEKTGIEGKYQIVKI